MFSEILIFLLLGVILSPSFALLCYHSLSFSFEFVWWEVVDGFPVITIVSTQLHLLLFCCWNCGCCWAVTIFCAFGSSKDKSSCSSFYWYPLVGKKQNYWLDWQELFVKSKKSVLSSDKWCTLMTNRTIFMIKGIRWIHRTWALKNPKKYPNWMLFSDNIKGRLKKNKVKNLGHCPKFVTPSPYSELGTFLIEKFFTGFLRWVIFFCVWFNEICS